MELYRNFAEFYRIFYGTLWKFYGIWQKFYRNFSQSHHETSKVKRTDENIRRNGTSEIWYRHRWNRRANMESVSVESASENRYRYITTWNLWYLFFRPSLNFLFSFASSVRAIRPVNPKLSRHLKFFTRHLSCGDWHSWGLIIFFFF